HEHLPAVAFPARPHAHPPRPWSAHWPDRGNGHRAPPGRADRAPQDLARRGGGTAPRASDPADRRRAAAPDQATRRDPLGQGWPTLTLAPLAVGDAVAGYAPVTASARKARPMAATRAPSPMTRVVTCQAWYAPSREPRRVWPMKAVWRSRVRRSSLPPQACNSSAICAYVRPPVARATLAPMKSANARACSPVPTCTPA